MKRIVLNVLLCVVLAMVGCQSKEKVRVSNNTTLEYENLPPIIKGEFYQEDIEEFIKKSLTNHPEYLMRHVKKIVLCSDEEYEKYPISKSSIAFSNPNDLGIYTRIGVEKSTITHELAHIFDYVEGYHNYSESAEFLSLYHQYKNTFHFHVENKQYSKEELEKYDAYFNESSEEFFAGVSELYVNHRAYLNKNCRDIYHYLATIFTS